MTTQEKKAWLMDKLADKTEKFGCIISLERNNKSENFIYITTGMRAEYTLWNKRCSAIFVKPNECKILGTPPTLARVLLKAKELKKLDGCSDSDVMFVLELLGNWDLAHDSLEDQSDETIEYLFNIFKDENL